MRRHLAANFSTFFFPTYLTASLTTLLNFCFIFFIQGTALVETFGHVPDVFDALTCNLAVILGGHQKLDGLIVA